MYINIMWGNISRKVLTLEINLSALTNPCLLHGLHTFWTYPICSSSPFQLYAAISQNESPLTLGLTPGGTLVQSLKQRVVLLASNSGVVSTVQRAAQNVLRNGWSLLLPTAEERARALSSLLPVGGNCSGIL